MNLSNFVRKLPAPLVAVAIFVLSAQPSVPLPKGVFGADKIAHFIAYGVLSAAIALWPGRSAWRERPLAVTLAVIAIAALYGATDEFHQSFVPGRDMSAYDWLADLVGAVLGAGVSAIVWRARERRSAKDFG